MSFLQKPHTAIVGLVLLAFILGGVFGLSEWRRALPLSADTLPPAGPPNQYCNGCPHTWVDGIQLSYNRACAIYCRCKDHSPSFCIDGNNCTTDSCDGDADPEFMCVNEPKPCGGSTPVCKPSNGQCVQCLTDANCPQGQTCNTTTNTCTPASSSSSSSSVDINGGTSGGSTGGNPPPPMPPPPPDGVSCYRRYPYDPQTGKFGPLSAACTGGAGPGPFATFEACAEYCFKIEPNIPDTPGEPPCITPSILIIQSGSIVLQNCSSSSSSLSSLSPLTSSSSSSSISSSQSSSSSSSSSLSSSRSSSAASSSRSSSSSSSRTSASSVAITSLENAPSLDTLNSGNFSNGFASNSSSSVSAATATSIGFASFTVSASSKSAGYCCVNGTCTQGAGCGLTAFNCATTCNAAPVASSVSFATTFSAASHSSTTSLTIVTVVGSCVSSDGCARGGDVFCAQTGQTCAQTSLLPCIQCLGEVKTTMSNTLNVTSAASARSSCNNDTQCSSGFICRNNTCIAGCRADNECPTNEYCSNGSCVLGCKNDTECPLGRCVDHSCKNITFAQICGNGKVEPGEQCDEGLENADTSNATCRLDCTISRCGDGIVDLPGETCDAGSMNGSEGSGCDFRCQIVHAAAEVLPTSVIELPFAPTTTVTVDTSVVESPFVAGVLNPPQYALPPRTTDSGPETIAIMAMGAAAGYAWIRRRKK